MTDTKNNAVSVWFPTIIPVLLFIGSIATAYYTMDKRVALVERDMLAITAGYVEMDKYQRFLQRQVEKNDRSLLVVETKQVSITKTQEALAAKVDSILIKLENVGNVLVRIQVQLEQLNQGAP